MDTLELERPRGLGFDTASISSASQWMRDCFSFSPAIVTFSRRDTTKAELELGNGQWWSWEEVREVEDHAKAIYHAAAK